MYRGSLSRSRSARKGASVRLARRGLREQIQLERRRGFAERLFRPGSLPGFVPSAV